MGVSALLEVAGLTKRYGDRTVLDHIDLRVEDGEAVLLTGANGAGKSTLLRCVIGAEPVDEGTVHIIGAPMDEREVSIRTAVAAVTDDLDFFPDLSVVEHLDLFARAHSVPDAETVVDDVLNDIGLIDQSGQMPGTLSSGQRRRLALASALVRPFKLLILDEPEQRLDADGLTWLAARLARARDDGAGLLVASHSPILIDNLADRVVRLGDGPDDSDG
ncbi:MAG TPA: ABC transporter ATP-binding protein [Marmoricola sp.]